ncbi:MAG TPA: histidine phosphatase family protein [Nocardioides sp.]
MGDLQCAARVFVARHGEAVYESELLSDHGGWLSPLGREQSRTLAAALAHERIVRVWSSPMARAVQTAEIVAGVLGVDVVVREGLREFGVGDHAGGTGDPDPFRDTFSAWLAGDLDARVPGAESGAEVIARVGGVLEEVADAHRGEAVLVISHGGAICTTVPSLAANLSANHGWDQPLATCDVIALEGDADGWVARSWAGEPLSP